MKTQVLQHKICIRILSAPDPDPRQLFGSWSCKKVGSFLRIHNTGFWSYNFESQEKFEIITDFFYAFHAYGKLEEETWCRKISLRARTLVAVGLMTVLVASNWALALEIGSKNDMLRVKAVLWIRIWIRLNPYIISPPESVLVYFIRIRIRIFDKDPDPDRAAFKLITI